MSTQVKTSRRTYVGSSNENHYIYHDNHCSIFIGSLVRSSNIRYFIYSRGRDVRMKMMKSKTTVALSTAAIAAVALLFAAGPLVGTQQALAYGWHGGWHGGWHHGWGWHGGWGWHRHWWHGGWGWHRHWR
jgi:hypothetical protein